MSHMTVGCVKILGEDQGGSAVAQGYGDLSRCAQARPRVSLRVSAEALWLFI